MKEKRFLQSLWNARALAVLRTSNEEIAREAMQAAVRGGFHIIEFTLSTPGAFGLIQEFSQNQELIVGAGTVLTVQEVNQAVNAGAQFLVSPVWDPEILEEAKRFGVTLIPGTYTPSEMWRAYRAGAVLQKLFPVSAKGPESVKAILAPMPFLQIIPTHGVEESNAVQYLEAGAYAVGFVGSLFSQKVLATKDFMQIQENARRIQSVLKCVKREER